MDIYMSRMLETRGSKNIMRVPEAISVGSGAGSVSPGGGAGGCTSVSQGNWTPGWCVGGTSQATGGFSVTSGRLPIANDPSGTYLFVVNDFQVYVFNASTGAAVTMLGTGSYGTGDNQLFGLYGIAVDSSYVYGADSNNYRIVRWAYPSWTWAGWTGMVGSTPGGGAPGCNTTFGGNVTPGWCMGGTAEGGTALGAYGVLYSTIGIGNGNIYVGDSGNSRVEVLNASTGTVTKAYGGLSYFSGLTASSDGSTLFLVMINSGAVEMYNMGSSSLTEIGQFGNFAAVPSDGQIGCNSVSPGIFSTAFCMGGSPTNGALLNEFNFPNAEAGGDVMMNLDGQGNLYVGDTNNNRVVRINMTN